LLPGLFLAKKRPLWPLPQDTKDEGYGCSQE